MVPVEPMLDTPLTAVPMGGAVPELAAEMVIVAPPAAVTWDSVMLLPPARTSEPWKLFDVFDVFPLICAWMSPAWRWSSGAYRVTVPTLLALATGLTLVAMDGPPPPAPADTVSVADWPLMDWLIVMLLPPTISIRLPTVPVVPLVFPRFDMPPENDPLPGALTSARLSMIWF